ncbi:hypothetical protein [Brevundimonas mediterranea]|uniref:hypothetical protein n=1 Tax=Brevundimonas mediterranea TaxID=74329 RepID=UPI0040347FB3
MAEHAFSTPAPSATPNTLADLIDAIIPLADEIMGHGSDDQKDRLAVVITSVADLALEADDLKPNLRLKARAMRLIYTGHPLGFEDGFQQDSLDGGSRAERLALQILAVTANAQ